MDTPIARNFKLVCEQCQWQVDNEIAGNCLVRPNGVVIGLVWYVLHM
jgi:hypothetical protein